jgi:hypothetical protein
MYVCIIQQGWNEIITYYYHHLNILFQFIFLINMEFTINLYDKNELTIMFQTGIFNATYKGCKTLVWIAICFAMDFINYKINKNYSSFVEFDKWVILLPHCTIALKQFNHMVASRNSSKNTRKINSQPISYEELLWINMELDWTCLVLAKNL